MLAGRTTLLVAHRRSTLHLADRIVVLDGGGWWRGHPRRADGRSALYRTLLSGLEEEDAEPIGDSIEALADLEVDRIGVGPRPPRRPTAAGAGPRPRSRPVGAPSIGPGLGRAGVVAAAGGSTWRPTPELLARVAALPPIRDIADRRPGPRDPARPDVQPAPAAVRVPRPLLVGLVLVVLDALVTLAGPVLVKTGIDNGVATGSKAVLFAASAVFLVVTLADLVDEIGETFVTGRAAQRIMLSLRIRIWAQLQRLSLDYYEREMAGRIMTRMTTDVDQFESLIENGLLSALVSIVTFVGVGVALVLINLELGLCTLTVVVPLAVATVMFRRRAARPLRPVARADRHRQRRLPGEPVGRARVAGLRPRGRDDRAVPPARAATTSSRGSPPSAWWRCTSRSLQFLSGCADAIVLGVGRRPGGLGAADVRRPDRVHPLHRHVLLPDPAAVAGLRLLAADPGLGRPHRRADAAGDR